MSIPFPLLVFIVLATVPSSSATSRRILQHQAGRVGFQVTLRHVDSGKNLTKFERLERAVRRGENRLHRFNGAVLAASGEPGMESSVQPGNGEFLMELSIGTPSETFLAIMDSGSDLIWTQCKPCTQCYDQPNPIFDPKKSKSFSKLSCSSKLCGALPTSMCSDGCEYLYTYGDYSSTQGVMATETFTFGGSEGSSISVPNVGFGCGEDNEGSGFNQGSGLVGLGRGPLSLVSQLGVSGFSYCLTSIDDTKTSKLLIGSQATTSSSSSSIVTTPLIRNPAQPSFYYLALEGISVGGNALPIKKSTFSLQEDGSGGLIIDSGTTITYIEESAFNLVKKAFVSQIKLPVDKSGTSGLDLCFTLPSDTAQLDVPTLVFHFSGGDLELPGENYMISDSSVGLLCLAMGSSTGMSIFGNVQQQNMMVIHDLEKETLSFRPTQCDQL